MSAVSPRNDDAPIKQQPLIFAPTDQRYRWKLWVSVKEADGKQRYVVFWKRIVALLVTLALLGWCSLAAAAYVFLQQKHDFKEISYLNLVLPHRWPEHRRALGRHYLAMARTDLREGRPVDALYHLTAGVSRVPDDLEARRQLAVLNTRFGRAPIAARILIAGLDRGHTDLEYLRHTFTLLFELQREEDVIELAVRYGQPQRTEVVTEAFIALQAATAHFRLGRYDAAEAIASEWQLARSLEGVLLLARCDWERGYPDLALVRLERVRDDYPGRDELPLQLIRFYRELGDHNRAHQEALVRVSGDPLSPGPRVDLLHSLHMLHQAERFARETDLYFRDFGHDPAAVLLLARLGADLGIVDLARRAAARAKAEDVTSAPFQISEIEALINAERYREARVMADALQSAYPANTPAGRLLAGWRAVAAFGDRDPTNGEILLQAFIGDVNLRGSEALTMSDPLERVGASAAARRLLAALVQRQPDNQAALTRLIRLDTQSGNLAGLEEHLPRLLAMSKPSRSVLQEAFSALNDATPARAELRRAIAEAVTRLTANPEPGL